MAENPLLPDQALRSLYAQTKRAASLDQRFARSGSKTAKVARGSRAALLAACTLQLDAGDLLLGDPGDETLHALGPRSSKLRPLPAFSGKHSPSLLLAAGTAAGLRAANAQALTFLYLSADTQVAEWSAALTWAQKSLLPLVVACADPTGTAAFASPASASDRDTFSWPAVRKQTNLLQLPVLTVDGEDAVAVYRCMQESVLRARAGGGPAILWASLPSARDLRRPRTPAEQPIGRLRSYLRVRKVPLTADA